MIDHLADWYRDAGMEPNAEDLPKRRAAIEEFDPEAKKIIPITRLFYGFMKEEESFLDTFRSLFQAQDPKFPMRGNLQEMAVLAGAALTETILNGENQETADFAALCMVSAAAQGLRSKLPVPEMPGIAARYLEKRTSKRNAAIAGEDDEDTEARLKELENELAIVSEETNMLWWLMAESSRDLKKNWVEIGLSATAIVAGKELADLTRIIPGPVAASAFLDRIVRISNAGKLPKALKVRDAIDQLPRDWRDKNIVESKSVELKDIVPITHGVKLSLTVNDGDEWISVFEKGTAIDHGAKLPPSVLAYQMFLEQMVVSKS